MEYKSLFKSLLVTKKAKGLRTNRKREACIKRNKCHFDQGVLTPGNVRRNGAKQRLCTVIHMVCGFMRGQMVPLKQEVIDIMTWPTTECGCVFECVCDGLFLKILP